MLFLMPYPRISSLHHQHIIYQPSFLWLSPSPPQTCSQNCIVLHIPFPDKFNTTVLSSLILNGFNNSIVSPTALTITSLLYALTFSYLFLLLLHPLLSINRLPQHSFTCSQQCPASSIDDIVETEELVMMDTHHTSHRDQCLRRGCSKSVWYHQCLPSNTSHHPRSWPGTAQAPDGRERCTPAQRPGRQTCGGRYLSAGAGWQCFSNASSVML